MKNPQLSLHKTGELKLSDTQFEDADLTKTIRDGQWNREEQYWLYPFSVTKINKIKHTFPFIEIDKKLIALWKKEAEKFKFLRELKQKKDINFEIKGMKTSPFKHQKVGVKFMLTLDCCMNFDELGNGKSWQALATAIQRKINGEIKKCLIICPASTKIAVWENEIKKHTGEKHIVICGSIKERFELYNE